MGKTEIEDVDESMARLNPIVVGKTISRVEAQQDSIRFCFTDGTVLNFQLGVSCVWRAERDERQPSS
jgi:hypothetical protein